MTKRDVVVVGGGFYGTFVAYQIAMCYPGASVALLDKEKLLFQRGSSTNQGQLHKGYMYSIDPDLAAECVQSVSLFEDAFGDAIDHDITSYYAIHRKSEIDPDAYESFCASYSLPLRPVHRPPRRHFGSEVAAAYATDEKTFNSGRLQALLLRCLRRHGVEVRLSHDVRCIEPRPDGRHAVVLDNGDVIVAGTVFNTSFADINALHGRSGFARVPIRCEVFLHFLLELPPEYDRMAISVIRGLFASIMPSRFRAGHLLAAAGFRNIRASDTEPLSEHIDEQVVADIYANAVEVCAAYLPVLEHARYLGNVVGTRAAFIAPSGETTSRVTPLLDFSGIENYHVILGGKVACMFEAREPALQGVRLARLAPDRSGPADHLTDWP